MSADLRGILSADDHARRFAFVRDEIAIPLLSRMLRFGPAWYQHKPPAEIRLTTGWPGKPRLAEGLGLSFRVAHSDGLGLLAFATAGQVGIDLEAVHHEVEVVEIAAAHISPPREAAMIAAASTPEEQKQCVSPSVDAQGSCFEGGGKRHRGLTGSR
jgi:phosphopantetheinyl transferase